MFIPIDTIINKIYNIDIIIKFKTMYVLEVKENKTYLGEFDSYEEARESADKLELDDLKTNTHATYQITLKEDYIENQKQELRLKLKELKIKKRVIWESIRESAEEYKRNIDNLLK